MRPVLKYGLWDKTGRIAPLHKTGRFGPHLGRRTVWKSLRGHNRKRKGMDCTETFGKRRDERIPRVELFNIEAMPLEKRRHDGTRVSTARHTENLRGREWQCSPDTGREGGLPHKFR